MGPRFLGRGNGTPAGDRADTTLTFNGAAVFRPRKRGDPATARNGCVSPSMGPRFLGRGNRSHPILLAGNDLRAVFRGVRG